MKRWIIAGVLIALAGVAALSLHMRRSSPPEPTSFEQPSASVDQMAHQQKGEGRPATDARYGKLELSQLVAILNAGMACRHVEGFAFTQQLHERTLREGEPTAPLTEEQRGLWKDAERLCQSEPLARTANMEDIAIEAARKGSSNAAVCYASGALKRRGHIDLSPPDLRYRQLAPAFIQQGIRAGSWPAASIAASMNNPDGRNSRYRDLGDPDPKLYYMYLKLMELGAKEGEEKDTHQLILIDMTKDMTETDRFDAETQAAQLFATYFTRSGPFTQEKNAVCEGF